MKIFENYVLGDITLKNRIVMAPMTRSRAIGNIPNALMAEYYEQRASAGLIITEGTSPSPNGLGYSRIPGLFSQQQVEGWKLVTDAVHGNGGKIFVQFMHTGRIAHEFNLPEGSKVVAPSAVQASGQIWTDAGGMKDHSVPHGITTEELNITKNEYVQAAKLAIEAGFDGVELHGANGYLLEQFLSPFSNTRTDEYGGSVENRCRFVIEVAEAVSGAIGRNRTAIRLSPYGVAGDLPLYPEIHQTYDYLSNELNKLGLVYIHIVDHSKMGAPEVPAAMKKTIRSNFRNTMIISGGYDINSAEADLQNNVGDLVAFGKPFISNPDLPERFKNGWELNKNLDFGTFYTADSKGYTDYPIYGK